MSDVCHATSVHQRHDVRIFQRECVELARAGYRTSLIVCDGHGGEILQGVRIVDAGSPGASRWRRVVRAPRLIRRALEADLPALVHLHDPELLVLVPWLRRQGVRVVYDSHEYWPAQILRKDYLPRWSRRALHRIAAWYESRSVRRVDQVFGVTEDNVRRLGRGNPHASLLRNFPRVELFAGATVEGRTPQACYVGGISVARGALEMARAAAHIDGGLLLAGGLEDAALAGRIDRESGGHARLLGYLGLDALVELLSRCTVGVVCLHPFEGYQDSSPNKLFEYMAAGLAVVASDFPAWRIIIETDRCGVCVDPLDHRAIADAVNRLLRDREEAQRMGEAGRRAVRQRYSWRAESAVLLEAYARMLKPAG